MQNYTESFKKAAVEKTLLNPNISAWRAAKEIGVSHSTLYRWIRIYGDGDTHVSKPSCADLSKQEQFNILMETAHLTEEARGAYCRQKGLYQHQLDTWQKAFMKEDKEANHKKEQEVLKVLRAENKDLKKELHRKEKALAEASALLVLQKKADLIWGKDAED